MDGVTPASAGGDPHVQGANFVTHSAWSVDRSIGRDVVPSGGVNVDGGRGMRGERPGEREEEGERGEGAKGRGEMEKILMESSRFDDESGSRVGKGREGDKSSGCGGV